MTGFRQIRQDLGCLPRVEDSIGFLYLEHRRGHQDAFGLSVESKEGQVQVPLSLINALLLGPGVSITSAAILALADHGCSVLWVGEQGVRFYSSGGPKTSSARNLHAQVRLWADPIEKLQVIRRMYVKRYGETFPESPDLTTLRGHEGSRVKQVYWGQAKRLGLSWRGRKWLLGHWDVTDKFNRALSVASSCLYGLCHTAIVAAGFSPGLGFIHSGDMRSFVLDMADLYRESITIPIAFETAAACSGAQVDGAVRRACRDRFQNQSLLTKVIPDTFEVLGLASVGAQVFDISTWEGLRPGS